MKIGSTSTMRLTRQELIDAIMRTFPDDKLEPICVVTEISEYLGDRRQSIVFKENLNL